MSESEVQSSATMMPDEPKNAMPSLLDAAENAAGMLEGVRKLLGHLTERPSDTTMPVEALEPIATILHQIQESLDTAVAAHFAAHHRPSVDAELIALCDRYATLTLLIRQSFDGPCDTAAMEAGRDARVAPLRAEQDAIAEKIGGLRAQTIEGVQARFRAIWADDPDCLQPGFQGGTDDEMLASLLRDLHSLPNWSDASQRPADCEGHDNGSA